ncbi:MAG: hypothetical protein LLG13_12390 [Bacteroidales bacterium]|nr:hypothetical protein [Bacteroidales bacterium]
MKTKKGTLTGLFAGILLFSGVNAFAQDSDCKVTLPSLAGSYSGQCKNGLASGKGVAQGTDRYEGQFSKGVPEGKGTYTWANGTVYKGQFQSGLMEGKGEMIYSTTRGDSVVTGYWKKDKYIGSEFIPPYVVTRNMGMLSYSLRKVNDTGNEVIIKLLIGGQINTGVRGLSLAFNSGSQFKSGSKEGIQNINFPLDLKIQYTTLNKIRTSSYEVALECVINDPGKWEVTINN